MCSYYNLPTLRTLRTLSLSSDKEKAVFCLYCHIFISVFSLGRSKVLVFDLLGEGNLPCITILKPIQRTKHGQPVLQFKRLLVDKRQILPLVIKNISNVPAQVR